MRELPSGSGRKAASLLPLLAALLLAGSAAHGKRATDDPYDARAAYLAARPAAPRATARARIEALRRGEPRLYATFSERTGATRRLSNQGGFLTAPRPGGDPAAIALEFVDSHLDALGLEPGDLAELERVDSVYSMPTGATHLYWKQHHRGIPVFKGQIRVSVSRDGRVISVSNGAVPGIARAVANTQPSIDAAAAVESAGRNLGLDTSRGARVASSPVDVVRHTVVDAPGLSSGPVHAELLWIPIEAGVVRLGWSFRLDSLLEHQRHQFVVDAESGEVWLRDAVVQGGSYYAYPWPLESPAIGPQALVVSPEDADASPHGWQSLDGISSFSTMQGNNVHAFTDTNNDDAPDLPEPTCDTGPVCGHLIDDLTDPPADYKAASLANVFYWTNLVHDVMVHYGFDEEAGNFQEANHSGLGVGGDAVRIAIHDAAILVGQYNNAAYDPEWGAPGIQFSQGHVDGVAPLIQVLLFSDVPAPTPPLRDAALDNVLMVHEYAHGITLRLVGSGAEPNNCFFGAPQNPSEGLSDFFALWFTSEASDKNVDSRMFAPYAVYPEPGASAARPKPYSTSGAVNDYTFGSVNLPEFTSPYPDGSVLAQGLWEVYWRLRNTHGFGADIHDALGTEGNQRMLLYLTEGLKMVSCENPHFLEIRDSMMDAAVAANRTVDQCTMWRAFAPYGMGQNASFNGTTVTEDFTVPAQCRTDPCGLGFEIAPVLMLLRLARRRLPRRREA